MNPTDADSPLIHLRHSHLTPPEPYFPPGSSIPITSPPEAFALFKLLPAELRLKIWRLVCNLDPVHITNTIPSMSRFPLKGCMFYGYMPRYNSPFMTCFVWPALLLVCREARDEAMRCYEAVEGDEDEFMEDRIGKRGGQKRFRIKVGKFWWDCSVVYGHRVYSTYR